MQVSLDGRIVLVTGAAQGIGQACARLAARSGAAGLMLADRNDCGESIRLIGEDAQSASVPQPGGIPGAIAVSQVRADLLDRDAPVHIVEACLARFGRVDGLINAAGLTDRGSLLEATPALWDLLFTVNAKAPSFLMQHCIADMRDRGPGGGPNDGRGGGRGGSIVNILSMNIHCGAGDLAIYSASKAALALLTRNAAQTHRTDRIRVNGINVGWVDTPAERTMHAETLGYGPDWLHEQAALQPFGRLLVPEDVARLAIFLLSDASMPMTGALVDEEQWVIGGKP